MRNIYTAVRPGADMKAPTYLGMGLRFPGGLQPDQLASRYYSRPLISSHPSTLNSLAHFWPAGKLRSDRDVCRSAYLQL